MADKRIVFIASKPLSKKKWNLLNMTGMIKLFEECNLNNTISGFLENNCNAVTYFYFDISNPKIKCYVELHFNEIKEYDHVVLLKHKNESLNEPWIKSLIKVKPDLPIIETIPNITSSVTELINGIFNIVLVPKPAGIVLRLLYRFICRQ